MTCDELLKTGGTEQNYHTTFQHVQYYTSYHSNFIQQTGPISHYYANAPLTLDNILPIHMLVCLLFRFLKLALQIKKGSGHRSKNNDESLQSHVWRKHWKLNQELWWYGQSLWGGRRERRSCGAESTVGLGCPRSVISDQAKHTVALWGVWLPQLG